MGLVIQKFGGTSLQTDESRKKVVKRVIEQYKKSKELIVVVSAIGRNGDPYATDTLINFINEKTNKISNNDLDLLMSCGEVISAVVLSAMLNDEGINSKAVTAHSAGIITDNNYGSASILSVDTVKLKKMIKEGIVPVVTGFQGVTVDGNVTTLGRGGSDTTASILGASLQADSIDIYSDVNGLMTADPKLCKDAKLIKEISYNEVFQLAENGAKVIHPKAVSIAKEANTKINLKNTFNTQRGTQISSGHIKNIYKDGKYDYVTGIANLNDRIQVIIEDNFDNCEELFIKIADNNISIDMINIFLDRKVFTIKSKDLEKTEEILKVFNVSYNLNLKCAKVTIIGNKITGVPGIMSRILNALKKARIEVLQTVDSLATIAVLVYEKDAKIAVNELHNEFKK